MAAMTSTETAARRAPPGSPATLAFASLRDRTRALVAPLSAEDACVQSMPDASPAKWHLAHTSWFFEQFILMPRLPGYQPFHERFDYLYNSYYYTVGQMHLRPRRGLVTRPSLADIIAYRAHVDGAMLALLERNEGDSELEFLLALGIQHEQQHQELLLTDIKHLFAQNPLLPAYDALPPCPRGAAAPLRWISGREGVAAIGHAGDGFAFDNETPRHSVLLGEHALASRLVTNAEFREFIDDGGYANPALWLADGWSIVRAESWTRPLYWQADFAQEFTLGGLRQAEPHAPVTHVSFYEADAFARWAGARLPTESEWESAAANEAVQGNFADSGALHPRPAEQGDGLRQLYGDAWEWTSSPLTPYPGFRPLAGPLGEYNGKFMCNQVVLRGGSCATPPGHVRPSYRNFFYPAQRWQFNGIRLAKDGR
jgi:ergothioneine biosynthesis protein EgtB